MSNYRIKIKDGEKWLQDGTNMCCDARKAPVNWMCPMNCKKCDYYMHNWIDIAKVDEIEVVE